MDYIDEKNALDDEVEGVRVTKLNFISKTDGQTR
jgi:hypothetical protein